MNKFVLKNVLVLILFLLAVIIEGCLGKTGIKQNIEPGKIVGRDRTFWGKNVLINWRYIKPDTKIPTETLPGDRFMIVWEGSVEQLVGSEFVTMHEKDCIYLEKGMKNALRADGNTAEILEVYWPVRLDYVKKSGDSSFEEPTMLTPISEPSISSGTIFSYHELQFCQPEKQVDARIIQGKRGQVCFVRMAPDVKFPHVENTGEQLVLVLRGWIEKTINDTTTRMYEGDVVYLTQGMVHGGTVGPKGCDVITIFSPARSEYYSALNKRLEKLHSIIPRDARPTLLIDGSSDDTRLSGNEGPSWMNGKLYFSNQGGNFFGFHVLNPDGSLKVLNKDIRSAGTTPLLNGNLAVCYFKMIERDKYDTKIIEMTPDGEVVGTIVDSYNDIPFGTLNDLIADKKGGLYFTDPWGNIRSKQPGTAVYYLNPEGKLMRATEWDEIVFPNGCVLSPDDTKFFVNDTTDKIVWVFDVNEDGTLFNKQPFAELILSDDRLGKEKPEWYGNYPYFMSFADGMTIDRSGNLYVATMIGIQVFDRTGEFLGNINVSEQIFHCTFGDDDLSTLFILCRDKIYSIQTTMTGFQYPLR